MTSEPEPNGPSPPPMADLRGGRLFVGALLLGLGALVGFTAGWFVRGGPPPPVDEAQVPVVEPPPPPPPRLDLTPATFPDLPGWSADAAAEALSAFRESCGALLRLPAEKVVAPLGERSTLPALPAGAVHDLCRRAARVGKGNSAARTFFETEFQPHAASDGVNQEAFFTGYYEPSLRGSRQRGGAYQTPLLMRPKDLIDVDLGAFRDEWKGKRIGGRLAGHRLEPYPDRGAIERGALAGRRLELLWVDDPVDAFFLHIQGSGRVVMADGSVVRVGYGGQNGRPYVAIGKVLIERGEFTKETVSMQTIRQWLVDHPGEAAALLDENPSYVFFRKLDGPGPLGTQGVPLTPGRSLAVDRQFVALGTPIYLDTLAPSAQTGAPDQPLQRLVIAQDTGGAITGPLRGDVFWGPTEEAAEIAGRMKHRGRMWVLVPKAAEVGGSPTPTPAP
ncbi:MAG: MltA domain-containing protein [Thermoanaerobaculia bacterium]|nr:MltA domain-containing protein [Thermoanaerobaculia bacterium]